MKKKLSIIVIARNEEKMIADCLQSASWADEIILVDTGSTDKTLAIARQYRPKIIRLKAEKLEYARWRNRGLKEAQGDWVFYLDADERITPSLRAEIRKVIKTTKKTAFAVPRRNFYFGREMHYGGAWPDYVKRLFKRDKLRRWQGRLHEEPVFEGKLGHLREALIHLTHRDLSSMLAKTSRWSKIEAELLYQAGHPPVTWWRILRIMGSEFWRRGIKLQGWRDGTFGWIEVIFQVFSRFVTYARLWEMQNNIQHQK